MPAPPAAPSADRDGYAQSLLPPVETWPVFDYLAEHLRHYPARLNAAAALLDAAVADGCAGRTALLHGDLAWTYGQLLERVQRIAGALVQSYGVRPGQCVLLRGTNSPMLVACWLAVVRAGAIAVASSPMLRAPELAYMVDKLHIGLALCEGPLAQELETTRAASPWLRTIARFTAQGDSTSTTDDLDAQSRSSSAAADCTDTAADDIAAIVFTSGTTGKPKAVAHFHRDLLAACDCWRFPVPIAADEVMCSTAAMAFTYGLTSNMLYPLRYRTASVLLAAPNAQQVLAAIARHRVAALCTVPTMLHRMLPALGGHDLSSLRHCFSSGEPLRRELWDAWHEATGLRIVEGYGSTELLTRVLSPSATGEPIGSLGKAVPGYTAFLVDERGRSVAPGGRGLLAVRGPTGCRYLGDATQQQAFVRDGWNMTGDLFEQDTDGCFWFVGRRDDIIVSSGYNIAPIEVERAVADHPAVLECAVVGVPDAARGMIVRACVVLRPGREASEPTARSIQEHVKSTIAAYKYPREVKFFDQLPRTSSGKVERYRLGNL